MALILHRSPDAEALARTLAEVLATPTSDPFAMHQVAVHSVGLGQWLAMRIAHHNGICAGVAFPQPAELVVRLAADALKVAPEARGSWASGPLLWALVATLPIATPRDSAPGRYLQVDEPERTHRLVTVAQRLANVFGAYGTYRPELARAWRTPQPGEPWEAPVWRALEARLQRSHLAAWAEELEARPSGPLPPGLGHLCVFTVSTMPPLLVEVLGRLADVADIHVFAQHPSPVAWHRAPRHPLLQTMGTLASDLVHTLGRVHVSDRPLHSTPPPRDSVLHALQADVHDDVVRPYAGGPDDSLQVHVCTSPLRQVQVLRDALLATFDRLDDLEPRDVVVMCPDVELYAPLVEAVLGDGAAHLDEASEHPGGFVALPYRLADRGVRSVNHAAEALLGVLDLADGRLEAPDVVDLLGLEPVRARFGLHGDDLALARELVVRGGARFARDGAHRTSLDLPDDPRFTWRFALDRLLMGQALAEPDEARVEGNDERRVLGGLVDFVEVLLEACDDLTGSRPPAEWLARLVATADRLLDDSPELGWQKGQVIRTLEELAEHAAFADDGLVIDLRTLRALLQGRFSAREPGRGFLSGSVTVCQLVPLRSIPFRVVALLGIDDEAFPRIEPRPDDDRMARDPQPGDRNARRDDRALFLEALLSAREAVIVTCTGLSEQNGRHVPMSVPLAEVVHVVSEGFGCAVVHHHPLQPWSPEGFGDHGSYDRRMEAAVTAWHRGREAPDPVPRAFAGALPPIPPDGDPWPTELTLADLVRFWRHPPSDLVRRRLGLRTWEDDLTLEATVPHEVGGLEKWALDDRLLTEALAAGGHPPSGWGDAILGGAMVSLGTPGRLQLEAARDRVGELLARARPLLEGPREPVDVDVGRGLRVSGRVGQLTDSGRVVVQAGSVRGRHKLDAWLHHLALHCEGWVGVTHVLGPRGSVAYRPLDKKLAVRLIRPFGKLFVDNPCAPLLFWADVSHDWLVGARKASNPHDEGWSGFGAVKRSWSWRSDTEQRVDRWILDDNPFHPSATLPPGLVDPRVLARDLWGPALDHQQQVGGGHRSSA